MSDIDPSRVNFKALLNRFSKIYFKRRSSVYIKNECLDILESIFNFNSRDFNEIGILIIDNKFYKNSFNSN